MVPPEPDERIRGVHGGIRALEGLLDRLLTCLAYPSLQVFEARILTQPTPSPHGGPHEEKRTVPPLDNAFVQVVKRLIELPEASVHEGQLEAHVHPAPIRLPLTKFIQTLAGIIDVSRDS